MPCGGSSSAFPCALRCEGRGVLRGPNCNREGSVCSPAPVTSSSQPLSPCAVVEHSHDARRHLHEVGRQPLWPSFGRGAAGRCSQQHGGQQRRQPRHGRLLQRSKTVQQCSYTVQWRGGGPRGKDEYGTVQRGRSWLCVYSFTQYRCTAHPPPDPNGGVKRGSARASRRRAVLGAHGVTPQRAAGA
jgi:hypothetical protein